VSSVSTEFNTLFESVVSIVDKIDPVKVNATPAPAAQALDGLGEKFGQSLVDGDRILDDLNARMPQLRYDTQQLAALGDVYAKASPDLWSGLEHATVTARTFNEHNAIWMRR
jgi:phospholipid/cholesterol/gamma-HCH transport system substrate-binding protein